MSVYYVYKEDRLSLFGRSLIGVIFKIQDYETTLKLDTFLQMRGCNIWGLLLDSHLPIHFTSTSEQEGDLVVLTCIA